MYYLLDTHILIWYLKGHQERLSNKMIDILSNENNILYFSIVSIWEVAIKANLNKPNFDIQPQILCDELLRQGFILQDLNLKHIYQLQYVNHIHQDPFDRLLIAQSKVEQLYFLTVDQKILQYPEPFILKIIN